MEISISEPKIVINNWAVGQYAVVNHAAFSLAEAEALRDTLAVHIELLKNELRACARVL